MLVVSEELLPEVATIPREDLPGLEHAGGRTAHAGGPSEFERFLAEGTALLDAEPVSRDAPAFWLYSSGSTGRPKGCVHLQHDMVVCAELFAKGVLGITSADRCFSVAKLFFAYGLGNALYFPLAVGGTSILWPGPPTPAHVFATIEAHRPTLFFSVPTGYAHAARARTRRRRSLDHPARGLGRRGPAAGALRTLQAALRHRHPRRHRLHRGAAHVHLEPARRDPPRLERAAGARLRRAHRERRRRAGGGRRDRQPLDQRRLDLRVLLESAREDQGHDPRPTGCAPATSTRGTPTATTGTRAAPTTC